MGAGFRVMSLLKKARASALLRDRKRYTPSGVKEIIIVMLANRGSHHLRGAASAIRPRVSVALDSLAF